MGYNKRNGGPSKALLAIAVLALSGCATLPDSARAELEHTSHPFAGPPFGDRTEEDSLNRLNAIGRWDIGARAYVEMLLGYKLDDGGFYGPDLTFTSRFGVEFWKREP